MQFDSQPSLNGHNGPAKVEVSPKRSPHNPTVFLDDLPISSWQSFLHHLSVAQFAGVSLLRLLTILWVFVMALGFLGTYPGGMLFGALLLVALIAFYAHFFVQKRASFIRFRSEAKPQPQARTLPIESKIAVYVTGECSVEGKRRQFTCLPGFYRTFATREHALLCQVKDRRMLGIASWRKDEVGLWYVFFYPATVHNIQSGTLLYGKHAFPTLAVEYVAIRTFSKTGEPERTELQTVFISSPEQAELEMILADLLVDSPLRTPQTTAKTL